MVTDGTAILIIRAWSDAHTATPLVVRILHTSAVGVEPWHTLTLTDADAVTHFVQVWLAEFASTPALLV